MTEKFNVTGAIFWGLFALQNLVFLLYTLITSEALMLNEKKLVAAILFWVYVYFSFTVISVSLEKKIMELVPARYTQAKTLAYQVLDLVLHPFTMFVKLKTVNKVFLISLICTIVFYSVSIFIDDNNPFWMTSHTLASYSVVVMLNIIAKWYINDDEGWDFVLLIFFPILDLLRIGINMRSNLHSLTHQNLKNVYTSVSETKPSAAESQGDKKPKKTKGEKPTGTKTVAVPSKTDDKKDAGIKVFKF